jgi:hypothetical protein
MKRIISIAMLSPVLVSLVCSAATAALSIQWIGDDMVVYDEINGTYWYPHLNNLTEMNKDDQLWYIYEELNGKAYAGIIDWHLASLAQMKALMASMTGQPLLADQVNTAVCDPTQWFPQTDLNVNCTMGRTKDEYAKREDPNAEEPWIPTVDPWVYGEGAYLWFAFPDGTPDGLPPGSITFGDGLNWIPNDATQAPAPHAPGTPPGPPIECSAWVVSERGPMVYGPPTWSPLPSQIPVWEPPVWDPPSSDAPTWDPPTWEPPDWPFGNTDPNIWSTDPNFWSSDDLFETLFGS